MGADLIRSRRKHHQSQRHHPQLITGRSGWRVVCQSFYSSASFLFLRQPWVTRRETMSWMPCRQNFKHQLWREAKQCRGKRCKSKKKKKRAKKSNQGSKPAKKKKNKSKSGRRNQRQMKTNKKKKQNKNKNKQNGERQKKRKKKIEGRNTGRQITGNATSCAMKAIKYARLFEGKASSIWRQVEILRISMMLRFSAVLMTVIA